MISSVSNNRFQTPQKQNFGATLVAKEPVMKQIQKDWHSLRFTSEVHNNENHPLRGPKRDFWQELVTSFENMTKGADEKGVLELTAPTEIVHQNNYGIKYTTGEGKVYTKEGAVSADELLPNDNVDFTGPYSYAVAVNLAASLPKGTPLDKVTHKFLTDM